ncbi:MAG: glycosyltransferase [Fibromonadaceae bacterium]|jgi:glycosyltransferase involved in cell wall biosynthesis|nr:glycosyltransferase [Fibromonadaceae bacterium]
MPVISIIVPIYKVEKYLSRCLDSILAQTFTDFECILVDDGSPDNCPAICDEYASKDNRFKVMHKEQNEGLAKARKSGLAVATAEFVIHIDSDDWIESGALELLYKKQQETDSDLVLGGFCRIYEQYNETYIYPEISNNVSPILYYLSGPSCMWGKLYRKSLFENYLLVEANAAEDLTCNVQIFSKIRAEKLQKIDSIIYNYDCISYGITSQRKCNYKSYSEDPYIKCYLWVEKYLQKAGQYYLVKDIWLNYVVNMGVIPYIKYNYKNLTKNDMDFFYKNYCREFIKSKYRKKILIRDRIMISIFNFSIMFGKMYGSILCSVRHVLTKRAYK